MKSNSKNDDYKIIRKIKRKVINLIYSADGCHYGSNLSAVDIIYSIYKHFVSSKNVEFILSKPHAAPTLYTIFNQFGLLSDEDLSTFCQYRSKMIFLPTKSIEGIHIGLGAVGQGFPLGLGMALGYKFDENKKTIFVLMGDGELAEGSVWEAVVFAGHHKINNIVVIVDKNGCQASGHTKNILNNENFDKAIEHFGWKTLKVNGHDLNALRMRLLEAFEYRSGPVMIFADTVKGKGVSFIEKNPLAWHYGKMNEENLKQALLELNDD
jgi:transketolase